MSDIIKHECGIALIRLLKPLEYYLQKYGTSFFGMNKLYLLMEKQHNRGQDGAGIANIKFDTLAGKQFINRNRSNSIQPIKDIFSEFYANLEQVKNQNFKRLNDVNWLKNNIDFTGELFLGHVRYGTFGKNNINTVHPFVRRSHWLTKNLVLAGNFNLTNVDELFHQLVGFGQHPIETADTVTVMENLAHFLGKEVENQHANIKKEGCSKQDMTDEIAKRMDIHNILQKSSQQWDGGYVISGLLGHGDAFVMRDPSGIRPAYYYINDEVAVVASERPAIQTAFNANYEAINELEPGTAIVIKKSGDISFKAFTEKRQRKACSFERIYFSRGTDADIYQERKKLGKLLSKKVLEAINYDIDNTVFSYIPNTAAVAFRGLAESLELYCSEYKIEKIQQGNLNKDEIDHLIKFRPRIEKVAIKDAKLRTFITDDSSRNDLVAHVYDITYGTIKNNIDTLVILDDSVVRGTTLRESILRILDRLNPKKIIIVSSAPQIRYPDCYGIDMARLDAFIAFQAAISLLMKNHKENIINQVYKDCVAQRNLPKEQMINHVKRIYKEFTAWEISEEIARILTPDNLKADFEIIYQSIEDLHEACPNNTGDWYFTGDYPTPGGFKVVNTAFINYIEGNKNRAY